MDQWTENAIKDEILCSARRRCQEESRDLVRSRERTQEPMSSAHRELQGVSANTR